MASKMLSCRNRQDPNPRMNGDATIIFQYLYSKEYKGKMMQA
jgi:hypothetical protein